MRYAGQNYELPVAWPAGPLGPAVLAELIEGFERAHAQMYGYIAAEERIQAVTFRLEAVGIVRRPETRAHAPSATALASATVSVSATIGTRDVWLPDAGELVAVAVYDRERLEPGHRLSGPAIVEQMDATTLLLPGQTAAVDPNLNLDVAS